MQRSLLFLLSLIYPFIILAGQPSGGVKGTVKTSDGKPAVAISIRIKGTGMGTQTDENGSFAILHISSGSYVLVTSGVGLQSQEKKFTIKDDEVVTLNLTMRENAAELQEITVTGARTNKFAKTESEFVSKMPLKNLENPQVYSVVTKDLLTEQLVFSVDDAIRNAPGISKMWEATGRSGDGGAYYNSRGFTIQSNLRNGIAGGVSSAIDAANLERLEVIKGPSATLFGSALGSYGGFINRVTKKPLDTTAVEIGIAGGSYDFYRGSVDINTPLAPSKTLLFRVNAAYNHEGSFQNVGFSRNVAITPSLQYKPNDRLTVNLDAEFISGKNIGKQIIFFNTPTSVLGVTRADQVNLDYKQSYIGDDLFQKSRSSNLFGQVNYKLSEKFTSSTNITASHSYSDGFGPYFYLAPDSSITKNPADAGKSNYLLRNDQSTRDSKRDIFEIQQNFIGDFRIGSLRNRLVVGLDFLRINSDQHFVWGYLDAVPMNSPGFNYGSFNAQNMSAVYARGGGGVYPSVEKSNTYSAFASDVLNLSDRLSILAALRLDHFDNKGGTVGVPVKSYSQTALSPKFGAVYQLVKDQVSLFANYQNAFKNQNTYAAYNPADPSTPIVTSAKPEQADQFEGGVKVDALGGRLTTTLSYYDIKVKNMLRTDLRAPLTSVQDGTQLSRGLEFEMIGNPVMGLNVIAGFSYNDSKYDKADADVNGLRPTTAGSPYLANLWLSYRIPGSQLKGLGFGFGGNYASDNKILNSVSMGTFTLPAYTVLNATVFYDRPAYRIGLKADNITNEHYWIGYSTMNPQKLRSFSASLAYKF
ncbi:TonB-dependent siderophore receptor [Arcticibacter sp. MXS-1]|uniref:TonB-dependent siderophore receptor n=1 Tax=Arcticibacter sp. MXS-1 TaxID=3341726 RepID=UPI0035A95944